MLAALATLVTSAASAGSGSATAAPTPATSIVYGCDGAKLVQPRTLSSIFCADLGIIVTDITWLGWTDPFAVGYGTEHRNLCEPTCAAGRYAVYPVGVYLFAPQRGAFTEVSLYSSVTAPPETYQLTGFPH
ncbi:hypothetical protein [Gordonia rhizosphera]|uniref:Lipoprotein n=1 Tax=Gordonia rhizosphera NBRC 16068 TaxID=1108045 RepID=K6UYK1_9ACTN|nr:hypothetical protein [Gordonia rhizosphera]GAB88528.1 hypothetical protein GORHZ_026_00270 [Gordonia rhizosphera NBRC 16068]